MTRRQAALELIRATDQLRLLHRYGRATYVDTLRVADCMREYGRAGGCS